MDDHPVNKVVNRILSAGMFCAAIIVLPLFVWAVLSPNRPADQKIVAGVMTVVTMWIIYRRRPAWLSRRLSLPKPKPTGMAQVPASIRWISAAVCFCMATIVLLAGPLDQPIWMWIGVTVLFVAGGSYASVRAIQENRSAVKPRAATPDGPSESN